MYIFTLVERLNFSGVLNDKAVNDFLETIHIHKIFDIKFSTLLVEGMATKYAMVIYD